MEFTLYTSDSAGNAKNCRYPHKKEISDAVALAEAVRCDNVCGHFKDDYRSSDNFMGCDCIMMDVDNDHTDDESKWLTPEGLAERLPDVALSTVPSRNNMKEKNGKKARPKFHAVFPIASTDDADRVADIKRRLKAKVPEFDGNALDAARFVFGAPCDEGDVLWQKGWLNIDDALEPEDSLEDLLPAKPLGVIPKGQRNNRMSQFAGRILKRYGECDRSWQLFMEESRKCEVPLSDHELKTIWGSAVKFYKDKVCKQDGYVMPSEYNDPNKTPGYLKPDDYSDIGEAKVLVREYGDILCYTTGTDYLYYDGRVWNESKQQAVGAMEEFLDLQLYDAMLLCAETKKAVMEAGIDPDSVTKKELGAVSEDAMEKYIAYLEARQYYAFVMKRRDMKYVVSTLQAAKPMLEISINELDADPDLLNTPAGTYDLTEGLGSLRPHDPKDHITKITDAIPSDMGMEDWEKQLDLTFLGKKEIIDYTQMSLGETLFGKVENEQLRIAYGSGNNGKSSIFNSCAGALGSYAGTISADALTSGCRRNVKPEIAEIKGQRLIIAGELEEGARLSASIVKQLCSTDRIKGEKKYKDPFDFVPTHSIVLYTNHLPKVGAMDAGIWRRLAIIPCNACFSGKDEIKNYTEHLIHNCGGYILKWLIEGAKKAYDAQFKYDKPSEVQAAIDKYRSDNDWFSHFVDECCEVGSGFEEKSGDFYASYRSYCARVGDYARSTTEFYNVVENRGYTRQRRNDGRYVIGIRLAEDTDF